MITASMSRSGFTRGQLTGTIAVVRPVVYVRILALGLLLSILLLNLLGLLLSSNAPAAG
jgi:hypothetical protein